jgi:hypothetical protein
MHPIADRCSRLLVAALAAVLLLGACVAFEPEDPLDPITVPDSNDEMMEAQQEEVEADSDR